jgi:hypothetical protein
MYCFKILNRIKLDCYIKFVVRELNFEIVKFGMVVLAGRENADVTDADVPVGWKLQPAAGTIVGESERESWCSVGESEIQPANQ